MKEKHKKSHILGAVIMTIGAIIILFPGMVKVNPGDLLILLGTAIAPFGNHFQQKARKLVSTEYMLFLRSLVASIVILPLAYFLEERVSAVQIESALWFLLLNGVILLGLTKIFWIEAIHRISVSKAISLETITPAITLTFAYFILGEVPTFWQLAGLIPILFGALLILDVFPKTKPQFRTSG